MAYEWHPIPVTVKKLALEGKIAEFKIGRKGYCLIWRNEKWKAFDAKCPHANGPFADGWIDENDCVICPWHRYAFDLKTGQAEKGGFFIEIYPIKDKKGQLFLGLKKKKGWFW
ncbi:MAG: Rieske 2Fe-2S domain-containing protein [Bacteroidia bacterium]|nr:Rieske 2Fe-2S domain-containing protein [Bacteroidia bacterium]